MGDAQFQNVSRGWKAGRAAQAGRALCAAASGLLMACAFPPLELAALAWIAWIPLVFGVRGRSAGEAARLGFFSGLLFWLLTISWLNKVTAAGWIALSAYCALFFIPFAVFVARWTARFGMREPGPNLGLMAGGAALWTGFEFLRYGLFTGFPWNAAGVAQFGNLPLIQLAALGGVSLVSAVVLLANLGVAAALARAGGGGWRRLPELAVALLAVLAATAHGTFALRALPPNDSSVRLALVQPAIPQYEKWTPEFISGIHERLLRLSESAVRSAGPDLIVWPETATPERVVPGTASYETVRRTVATGVPLLSGSVEEETDPAGIRRYFNRSLLLGPGPVLLGSYDKQHLVLYGEYVPFSERFPFLRALSPMEADLTAGTEPTVFELPSRGLRFSALICFEDAVPRLSRVMTGRGARLLINQTNDAWFDVSSASRQHLAQAVFRCVENRVPMARCGNTGLTAWIDEGGRIGGRSGPGILPHRSAGDGMLSGFLTATIPFRRTPGPATLYQRRGEWFGSSMAAAALLISLAWAGGRAARRPPFQGRGGGR